MLLVVMVRTPVVSMVACRLLEASAVLRSFSDETWPEPVPKVMLVAVPPPVAAIVSVLPERPDVTAVPLSVSLAARPSWVPSPELKVLTVTCIRSAGGAGAGDNELAGGVRSGDTGTGADLGLDRAGDLRAAVA